MSHEGPEEGPIRIHSVEEIDAEIVRLTAELNARAARRNQPSWLLSSTLRANYAA